MEAQHTVNNQFNIKGSWKLSTQLYKRLNEAEDMNAALQSENLEALRQLDDEVDRLKAERAELRARAEAAEAEVDRLRQRDLRHVQHQA